MSERTEYLRKRRRRRLLKWTVISLIIIATPIVAWLAWNAHANSVLDAEIQAIRSRGEPLEWRELAPKESVPDDQNAVLAIRQACRLWNLNVKPLVDALDDKAEADGWEYAYFPAHFIWHVELREAYAEELAEILSAAAPTLKLVRKARGMEGVDWGIDYSKLAIESIFPSLSDPRQLGGLLCLCAVTAHEKGDSAEAIEYIRDLMALHDSVVSTPLLISQLVGMAAKGRNYATIEHMAPTLRIGSEPKAATRKQVVLLIQSLLDESERREQFERCMVGERCWIYEYCEFIRRGDLRNYSDFSNAPMLNNRVLVFVFKPALTLDTARLLRHYSSFVEAARQDNYPQAMAKNPSSTTPRGRWDEFLHSLYHASASSLDRVLEFHFRMVAIRRMSAVALAIRLYEIDQGQRPGELADLVPKYLPAVPIDPFAADGRPIAYLRSAKRPLLYSVSLNGTDDGGKYFDDSEEYVDPEGEEFVDSDEYDLPFFLNADRPREKPERTTPSTQPGPGMGMPGMGPASGPRVPPPPATQPSAPSE